MTVTEPGAGAWVPPSPTPALLRAAVQECRGCELYRGATQGVMGEGAASARLMLLGEQPGDREDREGEPFVGPAGAVLHRALGDAGIAEEDVYITNVVKHFRFKTVGKRRIHESPGRQHVVACLPWLGAEMTVVRPSGVVLLGATAGKALYGSSFRVGEARGSFQDWPPGIGPDDVDPWVLATTHPSAVLRARDDRDAAYAALVADLALAATRLAA